MRAAVLSGGGIIVRDDLPEPVPGPGQVLVQVKACGICGSDLHFAKHGADMLALGQQMEGVPRPDREPIDLSRDIFMGHEFAGEVLEAGPNTEAPPAGTAVTSFPVLLRPDGAVDPIVYSNHVYGGYGERLLLSAPLLLPVPNGLSTDLAALTEPMAVGLHAVNRSRIEQTEKAVVLGCGPVGLAVIGALKMRGVTSIIAADYSPARRALAEGLGATDVVDPREETAWARAGAAGPLVVFEAIGVPGVLDEILRYAPAQSRAVVVGVCMNADTVNPYFGISKELSVQFVLGYTPEELAASLRSIAEGDIDVAPLVTARVGLDEVPWAFEALGNPEEHCKIIVEP
ncbi:threonine dehydrogenase-like Zn-dependent dehydrogenase [Antricoccus suffuscus]|uniref:Threonine dehydrogenase-like Zn-dependent dehydrogenase n=1 Tax=Antricoccus suffuscus TaxID=1629062 RepID=A0A2T1A368_9ACTN|nr:zinc-binding dehydrogenase [Antricoccus suffuscus]PRZ43043.1 threonine dehydrogenase-like Zn-dependent dehydrogenase [Antricoccus suffuscus]